MTVFEETPVDFEAKAAPSTFIVFGILFGILIVLALIISIRHPVSMWSFFELVLMMAIAFVWISAYSIQVINGSFSYRSLMRGTQSIEFKKIGKAQIKVGVFDYSDRFRPTVRLDIEPRPMVKAHQLVVNIRVFRKQDLNRLLPLLRPYLLNDHSVHN